MKMVRKWKKLYKHKKVEQTKEEILERIQNDIKKIFEAEKDALENPIKMNELSDCLRKKRNNVSPGVSGFSGEFYKMFWDLLRNIVLT